MLQFLPAKPEFVLHEIGKDTDTTIKITKAVLYIRRKRVIDSVITGHNRGFQKHYAINYVNNVHIASLTITIGNRDYIKVITITYCNRQ